MKLLDPGRLTSSARRSTPHPPPPPPNHLCTVLPILPRPPPVVLSSSVTQQRSVSGSPIFEGVRRDKGVFSIAGEASDKLLYTLTSNASTLIDAGGPASLPSHRLSFTQVSPLIILRMFWVICMCLKVMNQRYLLDF